jgi:hypothetical protein
MERVPPQSGEKRRSVEVVAENVEFLDRRPADQGDQLGFDEPRQEDFGDDEVPF